MIEKLTEIYAEFEKQGVADPLLETLRLADLVSGGMLAFEIGAGQENIVGRLFRKVEDAYLPVEQVDDGARIRVLTAIRR